MWKSAINPGLHNTGFARFRYFALNGYHLHAPPRLFLKATHRTAGAESTTESVKVHESSAAIRWYMFVEKGPR